MNVNFTIKDNHVLETAEGDIDLHNNFDFVGFNYTVGHKEIRLHWKKSIGDRVSKTEFPSVTMVHKEVNFLRVIEQDKKGTYEDSFCLSEISFFPSSARDKNDCMMVQASPSEGDDILYFFSKMGK